MIYGMLDINSVLNRTSPKLERSLYPIVSKGVFILSASLLYVPLLIANYGVCMCVTETETGDAAKECSRSLGTMENEVPIVPGIWTHVCWCSSSNYSWMLLCLLVPASNNSSLRASTAGWVWWKILFDSRNGSISEQCRLFGRRWDVKYVGALM